MLHFSYLTIRLRWAVFIEICYWIKYDFFDDLFTRTDITDETRSSNKVIVVKSLGTNKWNCPELFEIVSNQDRELITVNDDND